MKMQRILAIVMLLLGREKVSAKELAEQFEVSLRTVYRDIQCINEAGIPIWSQPGIGGGIGILPEYKVEKRIFTVDDILALLTALGFVSGAVPVAQLAPALAKIQSLLPGGVMPRQPGEGDALVFDPSAWMGVDVAALVGRLHNAIRDRRCVQFCYLGQNHQETKRTVEPYRLLFKQNGWYLQAWCLTRGDMRLFKLARMWAFAESTQCYEPRELPPTPDTYTKAMQQKALPIRLLVKQQALDRVLEYVKAEDMYPVPGGYEVDFTFVPDDFGYGLLLGFGTACECLAPDSVRKELARRAAAIHELYA